MDSEFDLGSSMEETFKEIQTSGGSDLPDDSGGSSSPLAQPVSSAGKSQPADAAPNQQAAQAAAAEAWRSLPKAWRKEMEAKWSTLDPDVMRYVHEREEQALRGITQYKGEVDSWNKVLEPFKKWFDHYKIDPREAFQRLATSHIVLKYGRPEDRAKWARQLIEDYGLAEVLNLPAGQQSAAPAVQPDYLYQLEQRLNSVQEHLYNRQLQENMAAVEKFFSDPANEFAAELQDDILKLFEKGAASTLQEAYEQAKWLNPSVRQKIMQREVEAAAKPKRQGPPNVKSSSVSPTPTEGADESIDDTLMATLQRIRSR